MMHRVLLFVAVPECVKDAVISEGFKTRRRNHIPATVENQALASFARASHGAMGAVLAMAPNLNVDGSLGGLPWGLI